MTRIACVIPARLGSTRFPKKIFALLEGKTLLQRVWEAATVCPHFSSVQFAIDSLEAVEHIERFGGKYYMTSTSCPSGTHRIIESIQKGDIDGDIFVNWQGDEPFIQPQMITELLQGVGKEGGLWTLKKQIDVEEALNPNVVKVVTDRYNKALYFSRSLIPFDRDQTYPVYYKHIGLYAYTKEALEAISHFQQTPLSLSENLEQLLWLEEGLPIYVYTTAHTTIGIDTPADLLKALEHVALS